MGQNIRTSLAQAVAEELRVPVGSLSDLLLSATAGAEQNQQRSGDQERGVTSRRALRRMTSPAPLRCSRAMPLASPLRCAPRRV